MKRNNRTVGLLTLPLAAIVAGCSTQSGTTNYECESGGPFSVHYAQEGASFDYREKPYELPATDRDGVYAKGDTTLSRKGDEVSLRILDEVVIWGCREVR